VVGALLNRTFKLNRPGNRMKPYLVRDPASPDPCVLAVCVHHVAFDGISSDVFVVTET
jgi:hypothetical protein